MPNNDTDTIATILAATKTIAVVGLSPKTARPSHQVASYMQAAGYRIIPVNPGQGEILGMTCYPDLAAIPEKVDCVVIFRRSEDVPPIARQAIAIGARFVWMQQGITSLRAATLAGNAGIKVVMDRCIKTEHQIRHTATPTPLPMA